MAFIGRSDSIMLRYVMIGMRT